jgi:hypothetical protein
MHECIVICPTADAVEPGFELLELGVTKFGVEFLQKKNGGNFFFEHRTGKKTVGNLDQEVEPAFFFQFAPKADGRAA